MFDERAKGEILKKLKRARAKRLYVQVPEGLKTSAQDLVNFIESEGMTVFLSVEPCFGACGKTRQSP
jgi:2-(3-amino-3-carboxypropyl)histidine synthase